MTGSSATALRHTTASATCAALMTTPDSSACDREQVGIHDLAITSYRSAIAQTLFVVAASDMFPAESRRQVDGERDGQCDPTDRDRCAEAE